MARWAYLLPLATGIMVAGCIFYFQAGLLERMEQWIPASRGLEYQAEARETLARTRQLCGLTIATMMGLALAAYGTARLARAQALREERQRGDWEREQLEKALFEANALVAEGNQAKARFVDSLGQALQSHLSEVVIVADMVMDAPQTERQIERLQSIKDSIGSLLKLMNDNMDLSIVEVNLPPPESIDFSLRCCLDDTLEALRPRALAKGLTLESDVSRDVPDDLQGDPGLLRYVLGSLIDNAIKFSDTGTVSARVSLESHADSVLQLHFVVSDMGAGMDPDKRSAIARLLENPTPISFRRSGLKGSGLLISSQMVKRLGGKLCMNARAGGGTTFHFTADFPLQKSFAWEPATTDLAIGGTRALVVSSDSWRRATLKQLLEELQMQPAAAATGAAAIAHLSAADGTEGTPQLVILDASLPDMDGFALAERLAQGPRSGNLVTILLTPLGRRGDARRCRQLGVAAYLTGPLKPHLLKKVIHVALTLPADRPRPLLTRHTLREMEFRLRVLLLEGEKCAHSPLSPLLKTWGHYCTRTRSASEAVQTMRRRAFDVIVIDARASRTEAFSALANIRRNLPEGLRAPICVLGEQWDAAGVEGCLRAGADACFTEPIQYQTLSEAVERLRATQRSAERVDRTDASTARSDPPRGGIEEATSSLAQSGVSEKRND